MISGLRVLGEVRDFGRVEGPPIDPDLSDHAVEGLLGALGPADPEVSRAGPLVRGAGARQGPVHVDLAGPAALLDRADVLPSGDRGGAVDVLGSAEAPVPVAFDPDPVPGFGVPGMG